MQFEEEYEDSLRTAAVTKDFGTLLFNRLCMGAKDAGAIQEELIMKYVIRPVQQCIDDAGRNCVLEVFMKNLFLLSETQEEHGKSARCPAYQKLCLGNFRFQIRY